LGSVLNTILNIATDRDDYDYR